MDAEAEANFFFSRKWKRKLLNSFWRVEAEAAENFWKFYSAFHVWVEVFCVLSFFSNPLWYFMEAEAEAAKVFEEKSGSGSGSGAKGLEVEAEAFLKAEANFFWKKFWKRKLKRIFFQKNFGRGSKFFLKKNLEAEAFSKSTASKTLLPRIEIFLQ